MHLLHDFQAKALERRDVHGRVGEQPDPLDAEVGEDLAAEADGAKDAPGAILRSFAVAKLAMQDEAAAIGIATAAGVTGRRAEEAGVWSIANPREVLCR